jgi:hypothetical protein
MVVILQYPTTARLGETTMVILRSTGDGQGDGGMLGVDCGDFEQQLEN